MKFATFVTLWSTEMVLVLTSAKLTKVFGRLGYYIGEELELDSP
jgi:hypothetical protein